MDNEKLLERAQEIVAEKGGSLTDAMILAENELTPKDDLPTEITVTIPIKPRVAKWISAEFAATDDHTTEERLGAYLATILPRSMVMARAYSKDTPKIGNNGARTVRRSDFKEASGT